MKYQGWNCLVMRKKITTDKDFNGLFCMHILKVKSCNIKWFAQKVMLNRRIKFYRTDEVELPCNYRGIYFFLSNFTSLLRKYMATHMCRKFWTQQRFSSSSLQQAVYCIFFRRKRQKIRKQKFHQKFFGKIAFMKIQKWEVLRSNISFRCQIF